MADEISFRIIIHLLNGEMIHFIYSNRQEKDKDLQDLETDLIHYELHRNEDESRKDLLEARPVLVNLSRSHDDLKYRIPLSSVCYVEDLDTIYSTTPSYD